MKSMMDDGQISRDSHIYYVDDGSKDETWPQIENLAAQDSFVIGIKLSRNCGHQRALLAGLLTAEGDAVEVGRLAADDVDHEGRRDAEALE